MNDIFVVIHDNGVEFDQPQHRETPVAAFTKESLAELWLLQNGFQADDHGYYWNGRKAAWILVLHLYDTI